MVFETSITHFFTLVKTEAISLEVAEDKGIPVAVPIEEETANGRGVIHADGTRILSSLPYN